MANRLTQQYTRGQTIVLEGAPGDSTFRIISGEVIICKKSEKGEQIPLAKLGQGEVFGEMYLFERNLTRTATAIALSGQVTLEVMQQDEVRSMMTPLHPAINRIFEGLSLRLNKISRKYVHLLTVQKVSEEQILGDKNSYIHRPPTD
jgi:CRP/FNR family transcriptional regulator